MTTESVLHLFEGYGIELEYMMVDPTTLAPLPISDRVLRGMAGCDTMSVERGEIAWSNELAMHVIELKSNGPKADLVRLHADMHQAVTQVNTELKAFGATLLATGMHPFFDPERDLRLWDSEDSEIYAAYDRIFSCKGHGWANLQAIHINLPFANDEEFARLHTAVRLILPLLPAVAASSPVVEGALGPLLDNRVAYYLKNQRRIASIIGSGIPEAVRSEAEYHDVILKPMFKDIAAFDPAGDLQHEWLNSRAAIARFERHAIEIRLLDIQECLQADFALIATIVALIRSFTEETWSTFDDQYAHSHQSLRVILDGVLEKGLAYQIEDLAYLKTFGETRPVTVKELLASKCQHLSSSGQQLFKPYAEPFFRILKEGALSERVKRALGPQPDRSRILAVYQQLASCLEQDRLFAGA